MASISDESRRILLEGSEDEQLAELERIILVERILQGISPDGLGDHVLERPKGE